MPKKFPGATPESAQGQLAAFEADQPAWSPDHNAQFWNQRALQHQQLQHAADDAGPGGPATGLSAFFRGQSAARNVGSAAPGFLESLGPRVSLGGLASGMNTSQSQQPLPEQPLPTQTLAQQSLPGLHEAGNQMLQAAPPTTADQIIREQGIKRINPSLRRPF